MKRFKDGGLVQVRNTFVENDPDASQAQVLGRDNIDPDQVFFMFSLTPQGASAQSGSATFQYNVGNEIVRDDVGRYHINLSTTGWTSGGMATYVAWKWKAEGNGQSVDEGEFLVEPTAFSP